MPNNHTQTPTDTVSKFDNLDKRFIFKAKDLLQQTLPYLSIDCKIKLIKEPL